MRPVLPETDVFLPNSDESALILGETDPIRQALAFRALGADAVVITCGEQGAVAVSDTLRVRLATYPVRFVNGSGGGDAFDAGYIAGLIEGLPEIECLKLASAVGASCVRAVGTTAGIFTRAEAAEFMDRHELGVETLGLRLKGRNPVSPKRPGFRDRLLNVNKAAQFPRRRRRVRPRATTPPSPQSIMVDGSGTVWPAGMVS